jgi:peptidase C39-like protein
VASNPLEFHLEEQECSEWCWAATAVAVGKFYHDPARPQQQCQFVSQVLQLGKNCCEECDCTPGSFEPCNQSQNLGFALDQIGHGRDGTDGLSTMQFSEIQDEINTGHPICVSIEWQEPAAPGHAIVIYGYDEVKKLLFIADPKAPSGTPITIPFDDFTYPEFGGPGRGSWKAAFRTLKTGE